MTRASLTPRPLHPQLRWAAEVEIISWVEARQLSLLQPWDDETTVPDWVALAMRRYLHWLRTMDSAQ